MSMPSGLSLTAEPAEPVQAVELQTACGSTPRGERRGNGPDWTILLHEPGADLDAWRALPAVLAADGLTVLTLDLPGHGLSDGPWRPELLAPAITAAVGYARTGGGRRIFLLGAGPSGNACLDLAQCLAVDAVVVLSPIVPDAVGDRRHHRRRGIPTLVFAGAQTPGATVAARRCLAGRGGWTMVSAIPTTRQGTHLLEGAWERQVVEQIVGFIRQCRRGGEGRHMRAATPAC